jgi:hypothetical protein
MKNWIVLILVLVGLSAAATVAVQTWSSGGSGGLDQPVLTRPDRGNANNPKAVVEGKLDYNFGTLPQRTTGKHAWVVRNAGKSDLELWMISSTCSCTLAKFKDGKKQVVKPGDSTEIVLEYETRENNGDYAKGAEIGTNDPGFPSFSLAAKGKVYPAVMTYPADGTLNFGSISNDRDDNVGRIAVFSVDRPETKVLKVTSANPNVVGEAKEMTPEEIKGLPSAAIKRGTKVQVHIKSGMTLGAFRDEAVIVTDHPKQPEVRIMLVGKMNGPINLVPGAVSMHDVYGKAGASTELAVIVASARATKFEVVKKPEKLNVEVVPADAEKKPGRYRLVVTVPPGTPSARIEDEILLKTDHPKAGSLLVPVSIWVLNTN